MANELTPVEKHGDYYFKRDDLYRPFPWSPVNGSKLRQCELLVQKNTEKARRGIVTGTSVLSPQAAITASVAKANGFPCMVMYGGTTIEALHKKKYAKLCFELGAVVEVVSRSGFQAVLTSKANEMAERDGLLHIRYGFDLMNNLDVFVNSVAKQASNIPDNVENIVVTVGSSITILGILCGIARYGLHVKNVYGIGCAPNRQEKIRHYSEAIEYETGLVVPLHVLRYIDAFNTLSGYKYEQTMKESYHGINFHPRYEAKTFRWLRQQKLEGDTLMWITGSDI